MSRHFSVLSNQDLHLDPRTKLRKSGEGKSCTFSSKSKSRFQLFERCLIKVLNIDLWKCYINYVRDTKGIAAAFRWASLFSSLQAENITYFMSFSSHYICYSLIDNKRSSIRSIASLFHLDEMFFLSLFFLSLILSCTSDFHLNMDRMILVTVCR